MKMPKNSLAADLDHILDHTRLLWEDLRGERLFITGGTGFLGCWLLESFLWINERLKLDAHVTVLTRSPAAFIAKIPHLALAENVSLLAGDIRTFVFPTGTFSHVIHAATDASAKLNAENPLLMLDTITEGTRRTLDFSSQCGAKNFLLTSSGAVYGKQPADLTHIPEDYLGAPDLFNPQSAYGQGKRLAEHFCALYGKTSRMEIKIARCFAFVGPYLPLDIHFAIGNFIRDGLNGGPIIVQGDGTPQRSYLYAADLAIWLLTILFKGQALRPYNVGSDESLSIAEVVQRVAEQFPAKIAVEIRGTPNPQKPLERYVPDIKRAKNELGLDVWVDLASGIRRTIKIFNIESRVHCKKVFNTKDTTYTKDK
ncbi:MAG: NAD-dependent epimerase/dehydratase family protein [Candidatus Atribacteria bacterium]|nr:NAD-dependent epimerase/dehydratase family protein [Candidatus Atribacteria bacterium]